MGCSLGLMPNGLMPSRSTYLGDPCKARVFGESQELKPPVAALILFPHMAGEMALTLHRSRQCVKRVRVDHGPVQIELAQILLVGGMPGSRIDSKRFGDHRVTGSPQSMELITPAMRQASRGQDQRFKPSPKFFLGVWPRDQHLVRPLDPGQPFRRVRVQPLVSVRPALLELTWDQQ